MAVKLYIDEENLEAFEALASSTRLKILKMLSKKHLNIKEIAQRLKISPAIVTRHIDMLERNGMIESILMPGLRGRQKVCSLKLDKLIVMMYPSEVKKEYHEVIGIGEYVKAIDIQSPCGLENGVGILGIINDPRYFMIPDRQKIERLWFTNGLLQYTLKDSLEESTFQSIEFTVMLSVNNHLSEQSQGRVIFGLCGKVIYEYQLDKSEKPQMVTVFIDKYGVSINRQRVSNNVIDDFILNSSALTFEIGAYYNGSTKTIVSLYGNSDLAGIDFRAVVN